MPRPIIIFLALSICWTSCSKSNSSGANPLDSAIRKSDNSLVYDITFTGTLYAFDANTGAVKWSNIYNRQHLDQSNIASPTIADTILYMPTQDGYLHAVSASTGKEKWQFPTQSAYGFYTTPVVANHILYIADDVNLYAINAGTGKLLWQTSFEVPFGNSPTVDNGTLYAVNGDGHIYSFDAVTGTPKGSFGTFNYYFASPVVKNGIFYDFALDDPTGEQYLNYFSVLDANTGQSPGNRQGYGIYAGSGIGVNLGSPTIADSIAYTSADSFVYAINTYYTGKEVAPNYNLVWKFKAGGTLVTSPTIDSSALYTIGSDGKLYALDRKTGVQLWTYSFADPQPYPMLIPSAVVANGVVYFASRYGFYAVWATDGKLLWHVAGAERFDATPCVLSKSGQIFQSSISGSQN